MNQRDVQEMTTDLAIIPPKPRTAGDLLVGCSRSWSPEVYLLAKRMICVVQDNMLRGDLDSELAMESYRLNIEIQAYEARNKRKYRSNYDGAAKSRFDLYTGGDL